MTHPILAGGQLAAMFSTMADVLDSQDVPEEGRFVVVHPSYCPWLKNILLVHRNRRQAAARRKRRRQQRCGHR